ncbi:MAG: hypothetical protein AAF998_04820, partial [Bacteroidota bacterium]
SKESAFLEKIDSKDYQEAIQFCDELLFFLQSISQSDIRNSDWYEYQKYLHNVIYSLPNQPKFEKYSTLSQDIDYRIQYYTYHRDQLCKGITPRKPFKESLLSSFYYLRGGALFSEFWWDSYPRIDFHDDFVQELISLTKDWKYEFQTGNSRMPFVDEGFWGLVQIDHTVVIRLPESDMQLIQKSGFPYHKKGFAERFPWEVKIWEKIVAEWKKGKWVVFLP